MCFSATASFGAGIVLTTIGVATLKKTQHSSHNLFASIPLIFGIQQISEGILWLTLPEQDMLTTQKIFTFIFLFFAQVIWPIWTPIAILKLEKKNSRSKIQKLLVVAGLLVGFYLAICLFLFPVEAKIEGHHIIYIQHYPPQLKPFVIVFYFLATIVPTFFSDIKRMWLLGSTIIASYILTALFYDQYVLSVWCFFSSLISLSIYCIITELSHQKKEINSNFLTPI